MNQASDIEAKGGRTNDLTSFSIVPGKQEVIINHVFNAPKELVFNTFTDPKHIPNWWGPRILKTVVEKLEAKPGGIWRFMQYDPAGKEHGFHGVFHEVTYPARIINTFEYEGLPDKGHVILELKNFESLPGDKTKLTIKSVFPSLEDRDGMIESGMESGLRESMDRLEELLKAGGSK